MVLDTGPGDPKGVPADAATVGFFHDPNWVIEDGMWVRKEDDEDVTSILDDI